MVNFSSDQKQENLGKFLSLQKRKENFLRLIFYAAGLMALPAIISSLLDIQNIYLNGFYIVAYILLLVMAFARIPYTLKASGLLVLTFGLAVSNLFETGIMGDSRIFLVAFITLSIFLFSLRIGIINGLVSIVTIAFAGWQLLGGSMTLISPNAQLGTQALWLESSAVLLLISAIIGIAMNSLLSEFSMSLQANQTVFTIQDEQRALLEEQLRERTQALDKRSEQLEAAAMVTRAAAEVRDLQNLLSIVVQQISNRFGYYHAGIFLVDDTNTLLVLAAASSKGGKAMLERRHKLAIGREGIVGHAAQQKRPRIAQDVGADSTFFNNPDLPNTQSEIALPLLSQDKVIGVLDIQSLENNAFSTEDINTLQTMTDQIAMAIENIRLIEQSKKAINELETATMGQVSSTWKKHLGDNVRGFTYTPLGVNPLPSSGGKENQTDQLKAKKIRIPLVLRGMEIGKITLARNEGEFTWADSEKELAQRIADQVALAVENARLLEDSQRRASREQAVNEFSSRFSRSLDVDTLLQNAVRELHRLPQVSEVSVVINPVETPQRPESA